MFIYCSLIRRLASYKVCLCFIVLSITVCTIGYVCSFCRDQIFMDFVSSLSIIIYEVLYTWRSRYNICSARFLDIRISTGLFLALADKTIHLPVLVASQHYIWLLYHYPCRILKVYISTEAIYTFVVDTPHWSRTLSSTWCTLAYIYSYYNRWHAIISIATCSYDGDYCFVICSY